MIIEPKSTTIAYRCPHCGSGVLSAVNPFNINADMVKLKCECGKSEMDIVFQKDSKVRLSVPCILCPKPHNFTVNSSLFFGRDIFLLPCPYSDINICFMGDMNKVKAELAKTELELLDMLEKSGSPGGIHAFCQENEDSDFLPDPQIYDIIMFVINDLEAEGKIFCKCKKDSGKSEQTSDTEMKVDTQAPSQCKAHAETDENQKSESNYEAEILDYGIRVRCRKCAAERVIPTDSLLAANAFLSCDSLYLE